ncbi:MAG: AraC family transcriptional regulator [Victivallaceae bacterium]|nr:AraC family transcriptional regulator [Victivallaceae bacterium]
MEKSGELPISELVEVCYKMKHLGYQNPLKTHDCSEIIFVAYGQMEITIEGSLLLLSAGDFITIPSEVQHGIIPRNNRGAFSYLNVMFRGTPPLSIARKVYSLNTRELDILRTIQEEENSRDLNSDKIILLLLNLLLLMLERRSNKTIEIPHYMRNRIRYKNEVVNQVLDYLALHYAEALDCEMLAAKQGVSATHLRRLVKQVTATTLSQHLINIRMHVAQHLLLESIKNINEIADKVGYSSFTHFCKVFKQRVGVTPKQYANSIGIPDQQADSRCIQNS